MWYKTQFERVVTNLCFRKVIIVSAGEKNKKKQHTFVSIVQVTCGEDSGPTCTACQPPTLTNQILTLAKPWWTRYSALLLILCPCLHNKHKNGLSIAVHTVIKTWKIKSLYWNWNQMSNWISGLDRASVFRRSREVLHVCWSLRDVPKLLE